MKLFALWLPYSLQAQTCLAIAVLEHFNVEFPALGLPCHAAQFGWMFKAHVPTVKQELHGYPARMGRYTLEFIGDPTQQDAHR